LVCDVKGNEVTGGWRKLLNGKLLNIHFAKYNQNDQVKENDIGRACSTNEEKRNAYRLSAGKPERKRRLGLPRHRWVNNIKMDLREVELGGMDWTDLVQDKDQWRALVNTVMKLRVP
jgi:hypothetical protein